MPKDVLSRVAYDGDLLADGSMDVKAFAPALLALGELIQAANRTLNGERAEIEVHVESKFERGSFGLTLGLLFTAYQGMSALFAADAVKTASQIAEYLGLISGEKVSLLALLKWLRGRRPTGAITLSTGDIHIHVEGDGNTITVSPEVYQLANAPAVRRAVGESLQPLRREGIDSFEVRSQQGDRVVERIEKADMPSFELPPSETQVDSGATSERPALLEVVKPSFSPELKWVFSDGSNKINATVRDQDFVSRVQAGERAFAKGDVLRVNLRSTPHVTPDGLRTDHEVTRVIEEFNVERQLSGLLPPPGDPE